jgi:hypothetical protein
MVDYMVKYPPYSFKKEFDEAGKLTGVKTVFHPSFLRAKREEELRALEVRKQEERMVANAG